MTFSERMTKLLEQGWDATKDFAIKTGAKAQDLGERGLLKWDIKQLEYQAQKHMARLGKEAYIAFIDKDQPFIDRNAREIKNILGQITAIKDQIEKKEYKLKNRGQIS